LNAKLDQIDWSAREPSTIAHCLCQQFIYTAKPHRSCTYAPGDDADV